MSSFSDAERSHQITDFVGLKVKTNGHNDRAKLGPSDIDMNFNYRTKLFLFGEGKMAGKNFDTGYDVAGNLIGSPGPRFRWMSVCDAMRPAAYWINYSHTVKDPKEPIVLKDCIVEEYYYKADKAYKGTWHREGKKTFFEFFYDVLLAHKHMDLDDQDQEMIDKYLNTQVK